MHGCLASYLVKCTFCPPLRIDGSTASLGERTDVSHSTADESMVRVSAFQYADEPSRGVFVRERASFRGEASVELGRDVDLAEGDMGIFMFRGVETAAGRLVFNGDESRKVDSDSAPYDDQDIVGIAADLYSFRGSCDNGGIRGPIRFPESGRLSVCAQRNIVDSEAPRVFAHSNLHEGLSLPFAILQVAVSNKANW